VAGAMAFVDEIWRTVRAILWKRCIATARGAWWCTAFVIQGIYACAGCM